MRVLLAARDLPFLESVQSGLWDLGHEAEIAADGLECSTVLRYFVPDLVVLECDLLWGGSDGIMALMRGDPELAGIPVLLITSNERNPQRQSSSGNPRVAGWLRKPFGLSDLVPHLRHAGQTNRLLSPHGGI